MSNFNVTEDNNFMWKIGEIKPSIYEYGGKMLLLLLYAFRNENKKLLSETLKVIDFLNLYSIDLKQNSSIFSSECSLLYINYITFTVLSHIKHERTIYFKNKFENTIKYVCDQFKIKNYVDFKLDYLAGDLGTIYFIMKLESFFDNPIINNQIKNLIEDFEDKILELKKNNILANNDIGIAHGLSGIIMVLSELYKKRKNDNILKLIVDMCTIENEYIGEEIEKLSNSWCRGKYGVILSRYITWENLSTLENSIDKEEYFKIREIILKYNNNLRIKDEIFSSENLCLCHGVSGNALSYNHIVEEDKKISILEYMDKIKITTLEEISWIDSFNFDYDGFMMGSSGFIYSLLRLQDVFYPNVFILELLNFDKE